MIDLVHAQNSTNIKAVGYDEDAQVLVIEFKGGSRYRYSRVPRGAYLALQQAESIGAYVHRHIAHNDVYPMAKVPPAGPRRCDCAPGTRLPMTDATCAFCGGSLAPVPSEVTA